MRPPFRYRYPATSPPRWVVCAMPPPGPLIDESSEMPPMIATKYFAGIGKMKYMQDRPVREIQRVGEQDSVDRARRADRQGVIQLRAECTGHETTAAPSLSRAPMPQMK